MLSLVAASLAAVSSDAQQLIRVSYTTVVDTHVSDIMPVFLSDDHNKEWSPSLMDHKILHTKEFGDVAWQQYKLPWPLAPRDCLLTCKREFNHRHHFLTSECHSVEHPMAPVTSDVVRLTLESTAWKIEALPGDRTRLSLTLAAPASDAKGVPAFVLKYIQRSSLKDSVRNLLEAVERLNLPPHEGFLRWQRTRAAAAAAASTATTSTVGRMAPLLFTVSPFTTIQALIALLVLVLAHVLSFGCLASVWRRRRAGSKLPPQDSDGDNEVDVLLLSKAEPLQRRASSCSKLMRLHGGLVI